MGDKTFSYDASKVFHTLKPVRIKIKLSDFVYLFPRYRDLNKVGIAEEITKIYERKENEKTKITNTTPDYSFIYNGK